MSSSGLQEEKRKRWPLGLRVLIFFALYVAGGAFSNRLVFTPGHAVVFWPPSGLLLGALLVAGPGEWLPFVLAAIPANILYETGIHSHNVLVGIVFAAGNIMEAAAGNWFLRKFFGGVPRLERGRDILRLVLVSMAIAVIGASVCLFSTALFSERMPVLQIWPFWWSANCLGLILFTPLALAWAGPAPQGREPVWTGESAIFIAMVAIASAIAFGGVPIADRQMPYPSLAFPILLWGSMRLPTRTLTLAIALLAIISAVSIAAGGGAFWISTFGQVRTLVHFQTFLWVSQLAVLLPAATVSQRRMAESRAQSLNENLERRVTSRTAELEESRSRYRELASIAPVGIFRMDAGRQVVYVNEKWCAVTGIPEEKALGEGWLAAVHPMDRGRVTEAWQIRGEISDLDFRFSKPEGAVTWVLAQFALQFEGEQLTGYMGSITDITARKEAEIMLQQTRQQLEVGIRDRTAELSTRNEELNRQMTERDRIARELLESESTLRAFFQSAPMMMGIVELMRDDIFFVSVNSSAASTLMGGGTLPAAGRTVREMGWTPEEIDPWLDKFRESERRRQPMRLRHRRMIGGQEREFAATVSFLGRSAAGQARYCYVAEDITESARAQETTERFRAILEATTDMVGMADKFGRLFYINGAGRDLLGLAPDEPLTGLRLPDVHAPWAADLVALEGLPVAMIEGAWQGETAVLSRNGPEIPASELILAHKSPSGSVEFLSTIIRDMSEQKEAEVRVKASLEEKEVLLKEIHHRVKNNLQIVSSLLQLQASYIKDVDALNIFEESRDRIKSMALIHEQLYQSNDLAQIDFPEYLRSLLNMVLSAHRTNSTRVETRLHVDPVSLDLDTAIPVGLITNELVTNSLKYAFAGRSVGEIAVRLTKSETGDFLLMVSDNGVGLPEKFNFDKATSLGLRLVRILSKQMRARLELSNGMGTQFRVYFRSQSNSSS
ncbi:MAG TPA: PAS domain S-box protein [Chthoniobacteraceae bacterium]|jgi:PAS domain S-box-containing protein|nr:PAS domain S-box protein [Chthoniobacteraceae bacterium]